MPRKLRHLTAEELQTALKMREERKSVTTIADLLGQSYDVVLRELKATGEYKHIRNSPIKLSALEIREAKEMLLTNTQKVVADHFCVKVGALMDAINRQFPDPFDAESGDICHWTLPSMVTSNPKTTRWITP